MAMRESRATLSAVTHLVILTLVGLAGILAPAFAQAAKPGDLDASFGNGGKVRIGSSTNRYVFTSVAIDAHGRIVLAGNRRNRFALARCRSNGALDRSFGTDGVVVGELRGLLDAMSIDKQGRIVAAGSTNHGDFLLARFHSDGVPDDSFGTGGAVVTNLGNLDHAYAIAIDSRGRIVAAGERDRKVAVVRYLPSGSLDPSFSRDGKVSTGFPHRDARATSVAIDSADRVIAAGDIGQDRDLALIRYSRRGVVSTRSFGYGGRVTTDFGGSEYVNSAAIDSQGRIVVAGTTRPPASATSASTPRFALARYDPSGSLDRTFGGDGRVVSAFGTATDMAIDSQGRIVVIGYTDHPSDQLPDSTLARYLPSGNLDPTFGDDGRVVTSGGAHSWSQPGSLSIDSQGRIVTAGIGSFTLARYLGP
jgi:uncharacterized delta-60 repeat protein